MANASTFHRPGFAARRAEKPAHGVRLSAAEAEKAWRAVIAAVKALAASDHRGVGLLTAMLDARRTAAAIALPADGEDAKGAALALSELIRTYPQAGEDRRGWHLEAISAAAALCEAILDQGRNAVFGRYRNAAGDD